MLSPTASNAPARDDTRPAARNVPVGGDGLPDGGAQRLRTYLSLAVFTRGGCTRSELCSRRRAAHLSVHKE